MHKRRCRGVLRMTFRTQHCLLNSSHGYFTGHGVEKGSHQLCDFLAFRWVHFWMQQKGEWYCQIQVESTSVHKTFRRFHSLP